jgi:sulfide:quinone oxidoreductase
VGAIESEEACVAWREEFGLEFPVVADEHGSLFRALTNGWVPWSVLVGPDGKVVFSENEFDEAGFAAAIEQMYEQPARTPASRGGGRSVARAGSTVVLGGGTGGLVAARELRRRLPAEQRIVLVDRQREHVFRPSLLWQMVGERRPSQFSRPLARLAKAGVEFRNAEVLSLDLDAKVVDTSSGELAYDSLVIALGAGLAPEQVHGFEEMAHNLYTPEGCARIHTALSDLRGGVVAVLVPELPFMCPAAPYEAAFLAESFIRKRGIRRNVEIHVFSPEHTPMPIAPAALGESVEELMAARGIHYRPLFTFHELRPETGEIVASNGHAYRVDLLMVVPPHRAPEVIRSSPLLGLSGFVHVDRNTLQTEYDNVYAIGDVATIKLPNGKALPKAGVFAHAEAKTVAKRIAQTAGHDAPNAAFDGHGYCWIEIGDGRAGFAGGDFYADPEPKIKQRRPSRPLHWGKMAFEKWWLRQVAP